MKPLLILLALFAAVADAAPRTLEWDANAPEDFVLRYHLYEKLGPGWTKIGESITTDITIEISPGTHTYAVTAANFAGLESERSNELIVEEPLPPPLNLRRKVAIQMSPDMLRWTDVLTVEVPAPDGGAFYRLAFIAP